MYFETLIGTTGIASSGDTLFIANNTVITTVKNDERKDISHGYDRIEDIAVSTGFLAGICVNNEIYGIFLLDLKTFNYTKNSVALPYEPYRILVETNASDNLPKITVLDDHFNKYVYDIYLIEKEKIPGIKEVIHKNIAEIDYEKGDGQEFFMTTTEIKPGLSEERLPINLEGDMLTMQYFLNNLFIVYLSHYNMYSIAQYDTEKKIIVMEKECGYFSTRIYICIHGPNIYVSSTLNRVIPLSQFRLTKEQLTESKNAYPLLNTNVSPNLVEATLDINLPKIKERKQSYAVDTGTADSSLFNYYVWMIIGIVFGILIYVSFMFPASGTINVVLLLILLAVSVFIIHSYI